MWSFYECAALASSFNDHGLQDEFIGLGTQAGLEYLKNTDTDASLDPAAILLMFEFGPNSSDEFILGTYYQTAFSSMKMKIEGNISESALSADVESTSRFIYEEKNCSLIQQGK